MHDIVKAHNYRGAVLCAAVVTERVRPGTVHGYESCATYEPLGKPGESIERSGCLNQLTPKRSQLKKGHSMAAAAALVEIELWDGKSDHTFGESVGELKSEKIAVPAE